jgi:carboxyl-terminal processing protease
MIRPFRLLATLAAAIALAIGVSARLDRAEAQPAPAVAFRGASPIHGTDADEGKYQLDRLPMLGRAMHYVDGFYVDPERIDPKKMIVGALEAVEKTVAEVMVRGDAASGKLVLTAGTAEQELDISQVRSFWEVRTVLGKAMEFVQANLIAHEDLREIEYAAANGMLSTLDPHSVLLEPRFFQEMKLQTRGEFGGLGFVIQMRNGDLTVVKVLKNTPAQRAGIRARDVITKIEEQSTVNMDLQDAVDRLRGKPSTRVAITIRRAAWPEPRRMLITREMISLETVPQSRLLEGGVGYVKLSQFSAHARRDIATAVAQQRAEAGGKLTGLVLDLRGNPGGLLDQAILVSDLFLSDGVIVKTVGDGDQQRIHNVNEATADSSDLTGLPLVVIVSNSSASASEIVAGALKNNNRALVIGRHTFGKGSVQQLYDIDEPGAQDREAALKLTVAQYLTPGDISIQETGITPDVLLLPGRALKRSINVFAPPRSMGEADLDGHFMNPSGAPGAPAAETQSRRVEKAPLELRYLLDEKEDAVARALRREEALESAHGDLDLTPEQEEEEESDANPDEFVEDAQIRFARALLVRAPYPDRPRLLEAAKSLVTERQAEEEKRLSERLGQLGVDWSAGPSTGTPRATVTVTPDSGRDLRAGTNMTWTVTVENRGDGPFRRLRAWTVAEKNPLLDRREFVFGTVRPGEKRSWTVPVKLPPGMDTRREEVTLRFEDAAGRAPADVKTIVGVVELPKPTFSFSVQVDDAKGGNGDGLVQRGETFTLRVDVRNSGAGPSGDKTSVSLKNLGDEKTFIKKGREVLGALRPGESRSGAMEVELRRGSTSDTLPVRITVEDAKMDEYVSERIELPVAREEPARTVATGAVKVASERATLRTGASPSAPAIATAARGAVLPASARYGDFLRVEWQKDRHAFVAASDVRPARGARSGTIAPVWQREPPRIALTPDPQRGAPVVDGETLRVQGSASVPTSTDPAARLTDVYVFVNDQKVFFKVVPESTASSRLEFAADLPLRPGNNLVTVVARENAEFFARRSMVVHRRPPAEVAQQGPAKAAQ